MDEETRNAIALEVRRQIDKAEEAKATRKPARPPWLLWIELAATAGIISLVVKMWAETKAESAYQDQLINAYSRFADALSATIAASSTKAAESLSRVQEVVGGIEPYKVRMTSLETDFRNRLDALHVDDNFATALAAAKGEVKEALESFLAKDGNDFMQQFRGPQGPPGPEGPQGLRGYTGPADTSSLEHVKAVYKAVHAKNYEDFKTDMLRYEKARGW